MIAISVFFTSRHNFFLFFINTESGGKIIKNVTLIMLTAKNINFNHQKLLH